MKNKHIVFMIITFAAFFVVGCSSLPKDVPYNLMDNEDTNKTASIYCDMGGYFSQGQFVPNLWFVDFEGKTLPDPKQGTLWNPIIFPAERELNIRIYLSSFQSKIDDNHYRRMGIFRCPPLEAGKKYRLWYQPDQSGKTGGRLVLTDAKVKEIKFYTKLIYVQEIPPM